MDLQTLEITGHRPGPHVLITGGVHGDEFEPMVAIRRLTRDIAPQSLCGCVRLVPCVNEPAFRRGMRTAEDGLDLARTCPGRHDGTVTEHIAAILSELIRAADFYIDLHTGGTQLRVLPLVGYMLHRNSSVLDQQRKMARAFGLPIIWGTDPNLDGRSLSVARDGSIPAIYAEYHGGGGFDPEGVDAYVFGCLNVLAAVGSVDRPVNPPVNEPFVVEDNRPTSGHMQINHPAPCEGFFEPAVVLGESVREGTELGTICDLLGRRRESVRSRYDGLVIVLHTCSRVNAGDGVAVVLETNL